jgi:hypothetical protein
MATRSTPRRLIVDGETFEVGPSEAGQGDDFEWVSGPNPGYGFSSRPSMTFVPRGESAATGPEAGDAVQVEQIRHFLDQIDPATGYIEDQERPDLSR